MKGNLPSQKSILTKEIQERDIRKVLFWSKRTLRKANWGQDKRKQFK
jgi:hypothetical protein